MELILVLMVISVVLALAAPVLRGFFASRQAADAAMNMLSLTQYARSRAMAGGAGCRLNIDCEAGTYWLTVQEGGAYVELKEELGRRYRLPEGASVRIRQADNGAAGMGLEATPAGAPSPSRQKPSSVSYLQFCPDGRSDATAVEIRDRDGECYELSAPSACEPFRVITPAQGGGT